MLTGVPMQAAHSWSTIVANGWSESMLVLRMLFRLLVFNYAIWDRRGWLIWLETGLLLVLPTLTLSLLGLSAPLAVRLAYPAIVLFRAGLRAAPWESRYWLIGASGQAWRSAMCLLTMTSTSSRRSR